ncbi:ribosome maturation protein SBDS, putative [Plasmodium sp. gorilla clade G2]|uniref:ribosome maturation protein SBDS, putative n=1 Tax=Plasmodium sp. gorilla clade G2 TaxID=880535 RepID=UPI000D226CE5|nr:ribosome maturation protein SBDS, putative [Plasmodium sp. gorilla clade G2]SOV18730.1 ribosome maturation protein SBDS, putative [Plasmodium sp. gorilla clade G2]
MVGALFQPINQVKFTNVAIVKYKYKGKKFEIACYKNKIIDWKNGTELNIDDVLQSHLIFTNISKGEIAKKSELNSCFQSDDNYKICKTILEKGTLQISNKERAILKEKIYKDMIEILHEMSVNPQTGYPISTNMIESMVKNIGYSINIDDSAKKQALKVFDTLSKEYDDIIQRAFMRIQIIYDDIIKDELINLLNMNNVIIEEENIMNNIKREDNVKSKDNEIDSYYNNHINEDKGRHVNDVNDADSNLEFKENNKSDNTNNFDNVIHSNIKLKNVVKENSYISIDDEICVNEEIQRKNIKDRTNDSMSDNINDNVNDSVSSSMINNTHNSLDDNIECEDNIYNKYENNNISNEDKIKKKYIENNNIVEEKQLKIEKNENDDTLSDHLSDRYKISGKKKSKYEKEKEKKDRHIETYKIVFLCYPCVYRSIEDFTKAHKKNCSNKILNNNVKIVTSNKKKETNVNRDMETQTSEAKNYDDNNKNKKNKKNKHNKNSKNNKNNNNDDNSMKNEVSEEDNIKSSNKKDRKNKSKNKKDQINDQIITKTKDDIRNNNNKYNDEKNQNKNYIYNNDNISNHQKEINSNNNNKLNSAEVIMCTSCLTPIEKSNYKLHCRSDFHVYNVKRKYKKLPPISLEEYREIDFDVSHFHVDM